MTYRTIHTPKPRPARGFFLGARIRLVGFYI